MNMIVQCKLLTKRIRSFFVINLDFYFFNDSVFHLGKNNLMPIFKIMADDEEHRRSTIKKTSMMKEKLPSSITGNKTLMTIIEELANRLFTVCAIHMEYPYVQYQGDSMFARVLASTL